MPSIKLLILIGIIIQIYNKFTPELEVKAFNLKESSELEIDIYTLNTFYDSYIKIPENDQYLKFYQIENGNSTNYSVTGFSIKVNELGTITPKNRTTYYYINGSITEKVIPGLEINKTDISYTIGSSIVEYEINNNKFKIVVNVLDYARIYAEEKLKQYVDENVKGKDSKLEQFELITSHISNYSYNPDYQSYITLAIIKSGDSWATSSAIDFMAKYAGIQSHMRECENDPNNDPLIKLSVIALIDGKYYNSKMVYNQTEGKNYKIYEIKDGYSYRPSKEDENKIIIYQYDGFDKEIKIPSKLDEKTVIGLDEKCFSNGVKFSDTQILKITIPDTIKSIGDYAFSELSELETILIPKSVEKIGNHVFEGNSKLKEIIVDKDNKNFSSINGILYDKKEEELLSYPEGKKDEKFIINKSNKKIGNFSFYKNSNLKNIKIPSSVEFIGDEAFSESKIEEIYFEGDPPVFGEDPFLFMRVNIYYPINNTKWDSIKENDLGALEINWEEYEFEEEEDDEYDDEEKGKKINAIVWVLISIGIVVIICAIVLIIVIKKKDKTTSSSIDNFGGEGLMNRDEVAL